MPSLYLKWVKLNSAESTGDDFSLWNRELFAFGNINWYISTEAMHILWVSRG